MSTLTQQQARAIAASVAGTGNNVNTNGMDSATAAHVHKIVQDSRK